MALLLLSRHQDVRSTPAPWLVAHLSDPRSFLPLEGPLAMGTNSRFKVSLYILTLFPPSPPRWIVKDYVCVWCLDSPFMCAGVDLFDAVFLSVHWE